MFIFHRNVESAPMFVLVSPIGLDEREVSEVYTWLVLTQADSLLIAECSYSLQYTGTSLACSDLLRGIKQMAQQ